MDSPTNLLTVDLEDWFVVEALAGRWGFDDWPELPSNLERNCDRLLALFDDQDVRVTWFVLGWCAKQYPNLIRRIADRGHEIACHSYRHRRVNTLTPDEFRDDTLKAIEAITASGQEPPRGYRAPSWSINNTLPWAFEILAELGFEYDSSIFPIKHDLYGMPQGPRTMFRMVFDDDRFLWEIPASTSRLWGQNLPIGGGGYLRHSPYWYTRRMIRRQNQRGQAVNVYVHPWEIDPDPPPVAGLSLLQKFRTYGSTSILMHKLELLLSEFRFTTMIDHVRRTTRAKIGFERS